MDDTGDAVDQARGCAHPVVTLAGDVSGRGAAVFELAERQPGL